MNAAANYRDNFMKFLSAKDGMEEFVKSTEKCIDLMPEIAEVLPMSPEAFKVFAERDGEVEHKIQVTARNYRQAYDRYKHLVHALNRSIVINAQNSNFYKLMTDRFHIANIMTPDDMDVMLRENIRP